MIYLYFLVKQDAKYHNFLAIEVRAFIENPQ
jgi:hypothetical protein